ncbi:hypothetical protein L211DRAFT_895102 [Terfezia boudieri ATCC MYA-4762]|uniref:GCVT N-terminal domain-containing protein n=1 Tax=Terfezia boudieri ATCC MYA-4762 TaxID=1051890 RepID=A0A3N4LB26_9PEZI|nr:hypothetical protein L211DRAFT_895102 [Terfezia boudieri ATCC MYA-4762]
MLSRMRDAERKIYFISKKLYENGKTHPHSRKTERLFMRFSRTGDLSPCKGPEAKGVLAEYLAHVPPPQAEVNLDKVIFGTSFEASVPASEKVGERVTVHIALGGYTGEEGFEISIPPSPAITESQSPIQRAQPPPRRRDGGVGSLRLEAGMCLYGHNLNEDITPMEASLGWVVHKRRRADGLFPGGSV